ALKEEAGRRISIVADGDEVKAIEDESLEHVEVLEARYATIARRLDPVCKDVLDRWPSLKERYAAATYSFKVRDKVIEQPLTTESLSGLTIPRVVLPPFEDWGEILRWVLTENVPGSFAYTAGV